MRRTHRLAATAAAPPQQQPHWRRAAFSPRLRLPLARIPSRSPVPPTAKQVEQVTEDLMADL